ncbi:MAG TPA: hypothetical protein VIG47_03375 [Gemmatimonadaceae bacterium]
MDTKQHTDFPAALTGLVVGGCFVFAILFGIVVITNHHYAAETTAAAATK